MSASERRERIREQILSEGEVTFASLAQVFGVSEMTIRRDVDALERQGVARRVTGGAIAFHGKAVEPSFKSRAAEAVAGKAEMAELVAARLQPKETVLLDSGSSALAVAKALKGRELGLTVVTPSLLVAMELVDEPDTTVLLTGGLVRPGELSLIGAETEAALGLYNCDTYVMGVAGVDGKRGISEYHRDEGNVKRAAIRASDRVILLADSHKLGRVRLFNVASLSDISIIVTDGDAEHPTLQVAREAGVEVLSVPTSEEKA